MIRQVDDWLDGYVEFMEESEASPIFHPWVGLSLLATAIRRSVWLPYGYWNFLPNMYIVLVGPPGTRKSTAMLSGKNNIVDNLGKKHIRIAADSTTREALIDAMKDAYISELDYSAINVFSTEFGDMLQSSQSAMIQFLTAIYDYAMNDYEHKTRGSGSSIIRNPNLNLIACTTTDFISKHLPAYAIGTGFTSRVCFVFAEKLGKLNPFPELTEAQKALQVKLVQDLRHVAYNIKGEMSFSTDAEKYFTEWYLSREEELQKADQRLQGFLMREPTHVIKISMLISLSRRNTKVVEQEDVEKARDMVKGLEPGLARLFCSVGRNIYAPITHRIVEQLMHAGDQGLAVEELLVRNIGDLDMDELRRTLDTVVNSGWALKNYAHITSETRLKVTKKGVDYVKGKALQGEKTGEQDDDGTNS